MEASAFRRSLHLDNKTYLWTALGGGASRLESVSPSVSFVPLPLTDLLSDKRRIARRLEEQTTNGHGVVQIQR